MKLDNKEKMYEELNANMRYTDEISFKLLGLVPFITGAAILAVILKGEPQWTPMIYYIAIFGALITFGLFRWELRNIKTCNHLRDRLQEMQPSNTPKNPAPKLYPFELKMGKTGAVKFIYSITVLSWLALPPVVAHSVCEALDEISLGYWIISGVILLLLISAIRTTVK